MTTKFMTFDDGFIPPNPIEVDDVVNNFDRLINYIIPNATRIPSRYMDWKERILAQLRSDADLNMKTSRLFICVNYPQHTSGIKVVEFSYTCDKRSEIISIIEKAPA